MRVNKIARALDQGYMLVGHISVAHVRLIIYQGIPDLLLPLSSSPY